ncbi:cadherin-4 isoform 2 precursor [Danio rerio]|uniref:Cadherin 4, retinal n=1 Tax=Danio rerio TaxID=7955 RepID=A4IGF0_DANRE|nr:cadherin-4 isoform 2 precursor [Danio rerio]AAI35070.1 Cadherin 4, retinal [Danio rerio]|eukprot:NP_001038738.2 cadherin-4 isoform 2 precursor [Danio rerio]
MAKMKTGCAILVACALVVGTSLGSHWNAQTVAPCRPGSSQSFYTVFVPRVVLQGLNIHKGKSLQCIAQFGAGLYVCVCVNLSGGLATGLWVNTNARVSLPLPFSVCVG